MATHLSRRAAAPPVVATALAALAYGCAATPPIPPMPGPDEIPELEARLDGGRADVELVSRLGVAYREAGRLDEARTLLERAHEASPGAGAPVLFLGLTYEDLGRFAEARELYEGHIASAPSSDVARVLRGRLPLVRRSELHAAARAALAAEDELTRGSPDPRAVAVLPFLFSGSSEEYRPLAVALSEMLVSDLSQTDRVVVLERLRVRLLVDEMRLSEEGLVDPATAVRSGRLLRAGHVVQGMLGADGDRIAVDAAVVAATPDGEAAPRAVTDREVVRRILELERRVALAVFESLGIELTPRELERVGQRPTRSLEALLAYGRGLQAEDAGDFEEAAAHYAAALAADPDFRAVRERWSTATGVVEASASTLDELAIRAGIDLTAAGILGSVTAGELDALVESLGTVVPDPALRDAASELLGTEGLATRRAVLRIILRRPGGDR